MVIVRGAAARYSAVRPIWRTKDAVSETFFKTLKAELIWRHPWRRHQQLTDAMFKYINGFYDMRRRHSSLGGISSVQFEQKAAQTR
jgi:putative transposase